MRSHAKWGVPIAFVAGCVLTLLVSQRLAREPQRGESESPVSTAVPAQPLTPARPSAARPAAVDLPLARLPWHDDDATAAREPVVLPTAGLVPDRYLRHPQAILADHPSAPTELTTWAAA